MSKDQAPTPPSASGGGNPAACTTKPCPREISVEFVTPGEDPDGAPDDGPSSHTQNHYTFSPAATGLLRMVLRAKVFPSGRAGEAKGRVRFAVTAIGASVLSWAGNAGGKPTKVSGDFLEAEATFEGLPAKNDDFGRKLATLYLDGSVVDTREYLVFFPKKASNHPGSGAGEPNWFHYWKEGKVCGIPDDCRYDPQGDFGYCVPSKGDAIHLGPDAAGTNTGPETYDSGSAAYGKITVAATGKGIKCVAETVEHERCHIAIYKACKGKSDGDSDGVSDSAEANLEGIVSDPSVPDTFRMGGGYSDYGDNEVRCRKKELSLTVPYDPSMDWANPGCQSKSKYGPS